YANASSAYLESADKGMILTRRIRSAFSTTLPPWPEEPSVLFVHAAIDHDLAQGLIDQHRDALGEALAPWGKPRNKQYLVVHEIDSVEELHKARALGNFSYIHVLAHGARVEEEGIGDAEGEWGLRLGRSGAAAASPAAIAEALRPVAEQPLVVTLASC